jgi:hypothetical protein
MFLAAFLCCTAQMNKGANDVPIVDPPERVAGYFKLNRTVDAHMFYFFYESRWKTAPRRMQGYTTTAVCCGGCVWILSKCLAWSAQQAAYSRTGLDSTKHAVDMLVMHPRLAS